MLCFLGPGYTAKLFASAEHYLPLCTSLPMSNTAVCEGFFLKVDSTPTEYIKDIFHFSNASVPQKMWVESAERNHNPAFPWVNKKNTLFFSATTDMLLFLTWLLFGFEHLPVSSLRKSFLSLIVWSQQKNYTENPLCWLTVQRAHKQDHLAIISSQSQIRTVKRMFIKKNGWLWERKKIG